jgi:hypothetical protein
MFLDANKDDMFDFEIKIERSSSLTFPILASSVKGEASGYLKLPFDNFELSFYSKIFCAFMYINSSDKEEVIKKFGTNLYDALLNNDIGDLYKETKKAALKEGKLLRFKLNILSSRLLELPWEALYSSSDNNFLTLLPEILVVRIASKVKQINPLKVSLPLQILGVIAGEDCLTDREIEQEKARLENALETLQKDGLVKLSWYSEHSEKDFVRKLSQNTWHILHYTGHVLTTPTENSITFPNSTSSLKVVSNSQFGTWLSSTNSLRLLILNLPYSKTTDEMPLYSRITASMNSAFPAVITTLNLVGNDSAEDFFSTLYNAIADKDVVDIAFSKARQQLRYELEWAYSSIHLSTNNTQLFFGNQLDPPSPVPPSPKVPKRSSREIKKLLAAAYQLTSEIDLQLLGVSSPTERFKLNLELKNVRMKIKDLEDEFQKLTCPDS